MLLAEVILHLNRPQMNVLESAELRVGFSQVVHPSQIVRQSQVLRAS